MKGEVLCGKRFRIDPQIGNSGLIFDQFLNLHWLQIRRKAISQTSMEQPIPKKQESCMTFSLAKSKNFTKQRR